MELPTTPTRQELGKFLPSQRVIRAVEQLFEWIRLLGNPPFGEMYASNVAIVVAVAAVNTKYEVTTGLTTGLANLMTFGGGHYLAPEVSAKYLVNWSMSLDAATANDQVEGGIMVDGVALPNGTAHTTMPGGGASATTVAASAIVDVTALSQLSLYVRNTTAARNITVEHASFTVTLVKSS